MEYRDYNHPACRKVHYGASGIGKSTDFLARLLKEKAKLYFIFDHKREFSQKMGGWPVCETYAQLAAATARGGVVLYNHSKMFPENRENGFKFFCKFVYEISKGIKGRKILVADELQEVAGPNDEGAWDLVTAMDDGRSLQIDFFGICQSANGLHTRVRQQLTEVFIFRQADENAIKHITPYGFTEDQIRNLRPGEWFWKNTNSGAAAKGGTAFEIDSKGTPDGGIALSGDGSQNGGGNHESKRVDGKISHKKRAKKNRNS